MAQRHRNLIDQIINPHNLRHAYHLASKGKRSSAGYLKFKEFDGAHLKLVREQIGDRGYFPGAPRLFWISDPKRRPITALPFRDRIVQHAINNVTFPIFSRGWLPNSYACIPGRGTHSCAVDTQAMIRRMQRTGRPVWVLKTDFSKYFYSIPRPLLWEQYEQKLSCRHTHWLLEQFTPREGTGRPIGALLSQGDANIIGNLADRYLAQTLKITTFKRYMDDIVVFAHSRAVLESIRDFLEFFAHTTLQMRFSHWSIQPVERGVNFVGYRIFPSHKLLRVDSVKRAKRKIKNFARHNDQEGLLKFLASWEGHAQWADSHNLIRHLATIHQQEAQHYASYRADTGRLECVA